jgi:pimeloyl-ACP methyl ester carboxylesterase
MTGNALNFAFPANASSPVPFTVQVDQSFVEESVLKASLYRPSIDLLDDSNENWIEGPPSANMTALADYWVNEYEWTTEQDYINGNFSHFAITVPQTPEWPHEVPLHFIHERAEDDGALPLLLLHGWPSTSAEWHKVIGPLVSPSDASFAGHHVVAPDLPGYGFSPAVKYAGFDAKTTAIVMDAFMKQLGYDRYGIVSTDLGWWIAMRMLEVVPEGRIAGHFCDFFLPQLTDEDNERYDNNQTTPEETRFISSSREWSARHTGYQYVQERQPLAVGQAFSDSPVGWAGWVWHILESVSDGYRYTYDEIITTAFVLFIQGTYGNIRDYRYAFAV